MELALISCNFDRVKALVEEDPTIIDVRLRSGSYPLPYAAGGSRFCGSKIFSYLLDQDPQMNVILLDDALLSAASIADKDLVDALLKHGANPNGDDEQTVAGAHYNRTPLVAALSSWWGQMDPARHLEVAELLVAAGARLDVPTAAAMGRTRMLRAMLNKDPKLAIEKAPNGWRTPMDWALAFRQKESARILLEYIPNPDLRDLIMAGDERAVRDYLDHHPGAAKLMFGVANRYLHDYPMTIAARAGDKEIAKLLLDRGADPNTPGMMMETVRRGDFDMVKFLIDHGADVRDKPGQPRLLDIANGYKHPDIADIIRQAQ